MSVCLTTTTKLGTVDMTEYWTVDDNGISQWVAPSDLDEVLIVSAFEEDGSVLSLVEMDEHTLSVLGAHGLECTEYADDPEADMVFGDAASGTVQLFFDGETWDIVGNISTFGWRYHAKHNARFQDAEIQNQDAE